MKPMKMLFHVSFVSLYSPDFLRYAHKASAAISRAKIGMAMTVGFILECPSPRVSKGDTLNLRVLPLLTRGLVHRNNIPLFLEFAL